ncbi:hypothetical protein MFUL124B02_33850 [Myxococcus fulvus 124B02]|nr:hypothetical protein MFUL124B02_33850 [Myxococcus fulvus 124B02]
MKLHVLSLLCGLALGWSACEAPRAGSTGDVDAKHLARLDLAAPEARIPDEYIVVFGEAVTGRAMAATEDEVARAGGDNALLHRYSVIPGFAARLDATQLERLRRNPAVAAIEQNQSVSLSAVYPTDTVGIDRVDQRQGRNGLYDDRDATGVGTHVYVLDTGINTQHSEFSGRIDTSEGFIPDGRGYEDCNGHGTHVASLIGGTTYGMARQTTLHAVRVLTCAGRSSWATVIMGLEFVRSDCAAQAARCVANLSLTGPLSPTTNATVAQLVNAGIPVVVAAGNDNLDACTQSPASEPKALTVAAVDGDDQRWSDSNWGACVDLFAPGVDILGAWTGDAVAAQFETGTSMASPHVAGALAQYLGEHPNVTPAQLDAKLKGSATLSCVADRKGSPDLMLFSDLDQGNAHCVATTDSCQGLCGQAAVSCFCDPTCLDFNDCCPDFEEVCL